MNDFDNKQICLYKDINRLGFTCDVCGRKVNGCRYINGMSFCEKCYQETFGKDNQQNEIQQLKQQLEEKDEQIKKRVMVYEKQFIEQTDEIYSLKQQLAEKQNTIDEINKEFVQAVHDWKALCAEKDKEIERLKNLFELNNEVVINQGKEIFDLRVQVLQQKQNQTQLAIQELEKVKDTLKHFCNIHNDEYYGVKSQVKGIEQDVCDQINQQIKELKGE